MATEWKKLNTKEAERRTEGGTKAKNFRTVVVMRFNATNLSLLAPERCLKCSQRNKSCYYNKSVVVAYYMSLQHQVLFHSLFSIPPLAIFANHQGFATAAPALF